MGRWLWFPLILQVPEAGTHTSRRRKLGSQTSDNSSVYWHYDHISLSPTCSLYILYRISVQDFNHPYLFSVY